MLKKKLKNFISARYVHPLHWRVWCITLLQFMSQKWTLCGHVLCEMPTSQQTAIRPWKMQTDCQS
jgi:hypothetical protein